MARCLTVAALVLGWIGFFLTLTCCVTERWKIDIDFWKGTRTHTGLWRVCFSSDGRSQAKYPKFYKCDKDYLRPKLVEPPPWFQACRALMCLAVFGQGFGMGFFVMAFVTDNSKKTGSRFWPAGLCTFAAACCEAIALIIFVMNIRVGIQFSYGGGQYFAEYWTTINKLASIEGVAYKVETWLRYSYGCGWGGVGFTFLSLIAACCADLTSTRRMVKVLRKPAASQQKPDRATLL